MPHAEVAKMIATSPGGVVQLSITPLPIEVLQNVQGLGTGLTSPASTIPPSPQPPLTPLAEGPRLCVIEKGPNGLGFSLTRVGDQHIMRAVDVGGPAYQ